jgi:hypothetical protein
MEKYKPPDVIPTEDGLEKVLTYIRSLKSEQLDEYL